MFEIERNVRTVENSKVQVECIHSETDVELQERINQFCEQLAKCGDEVINVSYVLDTDK